MSTVSDKRSGTDSTQFVTLKISILPLPIQHSLMFDNSVIFGTMCNLPRNNLWASVIMSIELFIEFLSNTVDHDTH